MINMCSDIEIQKFEHDIRMNNCFYTALVVCPLLCLKKLVVMLLRLVFIQLNCAAPAKASPSPIPCDINTGNVSVFTITVQFNLTPGNG